MHDLLVLVDVLVHDVRLVNACHFTSRDESLGRVDEDEDEDEDESLPGQLFKTSVSKN